METAAEAVRVTSSTSRPSPSSSGRSSLCVHSLDRRERSTWHLVHTHTTAIDVIIMSIMFTLQYHTVMDDNMKRTLSVEVLNVNFLSHSFWIYILDFELFLNNSPNGWFPLQPNKHNVHETQKQCYVKSSHRRTRCILYLRRAQAKSEVFLDVVDRNTCQFLMQHCLRNQSSSAFNGLCPLHTKIPPYFLKLLIVLDWMLRNFMWTSNVFLWTMMPHSYPIRKVLNLFTCEKLQIGVFQPFHNFPSPFEH